jgi:hypothetical protein
MSKISQQRKISLSSLPDAMSELPQRAGYFGTITLSKAPSPNPRGMFRAISQF